MRAKIFPSPYSVRLLVEFAGLMIMMMRWWSWCGGGRSGVGENDGFLRKGKGGEGAYGRHDRCGEGSRLFIQRHSDATIQHNTSQCTKKQTMQQTQILNNKQSKMQNGSHKQRKMDTSYPLCIPGKIGAIVMDSFPYDIVNYQNILSPS